MENKNRDWSVIFQDQLSSGLSIKDYCSVNHICPSSFYKYKRMAKSDVDVFSPVSIVQQDLIHFNMNGHSFEMSSKDFKFFIEALK